MKFISYTVLGIIKMEKV